MFSRFRVHPWIAMGVLLAGCHQPELAEDLQEITSLPAIPNRKLDLLFVVDNSASMQEQQASLAANFPRLMDVLDDLDGGLPDLHVGVITSDMGTSSRNGPPAPNPGIFPDCSGDGDGGALRVGNAPLTGAFITDILAADGTRQRNYTGELRDVFGALAQVGAEGCGFEQHLSSMRAALTNPANAGFVRDDANLAVVIIADEDDCSALDPALFGPDSPAVGPLYSFRCTRFGVACEPDDMTTPGAKTGCVPRASSTLVEDVQPFVDALLAVKPDPRNVLVAAIVGDPGPVTVEIRPVLDVQAATLQPSCTFAGPSGTEYADPAVRLAAFLDAFPGRSQLTSICSSDLSPALTQIGATTKKLMGDPCLDSDRLADASPAPGVQPTCEVTDVRDSSPDVATALPSCGSGATDCYEIVADARACPTTPGNLRVKFQRTTVAADTWTHVRCQLTP